MPQTLRPLQHAPEPLHYAVAPAAGASKRTIIVTLISCLLGSSAIYAACMQWTAYDRQHARDVNAWMTNELPRRRFELELQRGRYYPGKPQPPLMPIVQAPPLFSTRCLAVAHLIFGVLCIAAGPAINGGSKRLVRIALITIGASDFALAGAIDGWNGIKMFTYENAYVGVAIVVVVTYLILHAERRASPSQRVDHYGVREH